LERITLGLIQKADAPGGIPLNWRASGTKNAG
jgi:hypothetical protein